KMIGVIAPAYRQQAAKWLKFASSNTESKLPAYLAEAAQNPAPIVIAIDTQDMIDPDSLRNWLKSTKSLEGKPGKVDGVSYIYNNMKGITLTVTFGEQTTMQLTLNLGVPVGINSLEVKRTLIEYLEDSGAAFSDLNNAELTAKDKVVTLTAPLTDAGLRRIFSLIVTPNPGGSHSMSETPPVPQADVDAKKSKTASQRYFSQVDQMIDDLSNKTARANNYDRTAVWHDSYAKKIDSLSLKDVDPALADYGRNISQKLRAIGASLRGVSLKLSTAQNSLVVDYSVNAGHFGGWNAGGYLGGAAMYSPPTWRATSNLEDVRKRQADAVEKGADQREQIWQSIESDRQDVRKKMLETFGEDFTQGK
ncbi:MAG: hypothetical protein NT069_12115, partial [Planctomycetota bacterium]|nr:hypothetical protein [Planctomycetota bacterium]